MNAIYKAAEEVCLDNGSFKVETHRADKAFPLNSLQISAEIVQALQPYHALAYSCTDSCESECNLSAYRALLSYVHDENCRNRCKKMRRTVSCYG